MNGADHYREAERLLEVATIPPHERDYGAETTDVIAAAQVHATLALAAATALNVVTDLIDDTVEITAWAQAIAPSALNGGDQA